jgi:glutathione synthase/RimK-type ligase-like ATP-grasp enzyme
LIKEELYDLVNSDCRGALSGYLWTKFKGKWISHPEATIRASDKVYQLDVASRSGFRVPKTAIAQCSSDVAELFSGCDGRIIVKPIVGADQQFLETRMIQNPMDYLEESYNACPSIYQEYIGGSKHLRLLCMNHKSLCGVIETDNLDWRSDPNVKVVPWPVADEIHDRVRNVINNLGLEMGIVDIKLTNEGELVWFEVNPQGQFLFLEPLTGIPFIDEFSGYLIAEAKSMSA